MEDNIKKKMKTSTTSTSTSSTSTITSIDSSLLLNNEQQDTNNHDNNYDNNIHHSNETSINYNIRPSEVKKVEAEINLLKNNNNKSSNLFFESLSNIDNNHIKNNHDNSIHNDNNDISSSSLSLSYLPYDISEYDLDDSENELWSEYEDYIDDNINNIHDNDDNNHLNNNNMNNYYNDNDLYYKGINKFVSLIGFNDECLELIKDDLKELFRSLIKKSSFSSSSIKLFPLLNNTSNPSSSTSTSILPLSSNYLILYTVASLLRSHIKLNHMKSSLKEYPEFYLFNDNEKVYYDDLKYTENNLINNSIKNELKIIPSTSSIIKFFLTLTNTAQLNCNLSILLTLIYVERLLFNSKNKLFLHSKNWKSIFLTCFLITNKVWNDFSCWNVQFSELFSEFSLSRLNELEKIVLKNLKYSIKIKPLEYYETFYQIRNILYQVFKTYHPSNFSPSPIVSANPNSFSTPSVLSLRLSPSFTLSPSSSCFSSPFPTSLSFQSSLNYSDKESDEIIYNCLKQFLDSNTLDKKYTDKFLNNFLCHNYYDEENNFFNLHSNEISPLVSYPSSISNSSSTYSTSTLTSSEDVVSIIKNLSTDDEIIVGEFGDYIDDYLENDCLYYFNDEDDQEMEDKIINPDDYNSDFEGDGANIDLNNEVNNDEIKSYQSYDHIKIKKGTKFFLIHAGGNSSIFPEEKVYALESDEVEDIIIKDTEDYSEDDDEDDEEPCSKEYSATGFSGFGAYNLDNENSNPGSTLGFKLPIKNRLGSSPSRYTNISSNSSSSLSSSSKTLSSLNIEQSNDVSEVTINNTSNKIHPNNNDDSDNNDSTKVSSTGLFLRLRKRKNEQESDDNEKNNKRVPSSPLQTSTSSSITVSLPLCY